MTRDGRKRHAVDAGSLDYLDIVLCCWNWIPDGSDRLAVGAVVVTTTRASRVAK
jgi:hypothetical protein